MEECLFPEDWLGGDEAGQDEDEEDYLSSVLQNKTTKQVQAEDVQEEQEVPQDEEEVVEEEEEAFEEAQQEEEAVQEEEAQEEVDEVQGDDHVEAAPDDDDDDDADMDAELAAMEAAACAQWGAAQAAPSEPAKKSEQRRLAGAATPPSPKSRQEGLNSASKGSEKGASSSCLKGKAKGKVKGAAKGTGKGNDVTKGLAKGKEKGTTKGVAVKRPLSPTASAEGAPLAKRPNAQNPRTGGAPSQTSAAGPAGGALKVKLKRAVAEKLEILKGMGIKLGASAVQALALAEPRDAQILLAALAKKSGEIANPTRWVEISLERRASTAPAAVPTSQQSVKAPAAKAVIAKSAVAKAPVTKAPMAKAHVTKAPVAKSPVSKALAPQQASEVAKAPASSKLPAGVKVFKLPGQKVSVSPQEAKAPIAKTPTAKAPIAKAPVGKAPGGGKPLPGGVGEAPRLRTEQELEFFQMAVQAKLMALNKQGIWKGPHPLDEAALLALLSIDSARALEILDEAEDQGKQLASPSRFVRDTCAEEEQM